MTGLSGGKGLIVGGLTWVAAEVSGAVTHGTGNAAGDPEVIAAIIAAVALVATSIGAPLFLDWWRRRHSVNHIVEASVEQSELATRLMTELEAVRADLDAERQANSELRRLLGEATGAGSRRHRGPSSA